MNHVMPSLTHMWIYFGAKILTVQYNTLLCIIYISSFVSFVCYQLSHKKHLMKSNSNIHSLIGTECIAYGLLCNTCVPRALSGVVLGYSSDHPCVGC